MLRIICIKPDCTIIALWVIHFKREGGVVTTISILELGTPGGAQQFLDLHASRINLTRL